MRGKRDATSWLITDMSRASVRGEEFGALGAMIKELPARGRRKLPGRVRQGLARLKGEFQKSNSTI